jgi:hypothetical protein
MIRSGATPRSPRPGKVLPNCVSGRPQPLPRATGRRAGSTRARARTASLVHSETPARWGSRTGVCYVWRHQKGRLVAVSASPSAAHGSAPAVTIPARLPRVTLSAAFSATWRQHIDREEQGVSPSFHAFGPCRLVRRFELLGAHRDAPSRRWSSTQRSPTVTAPPAVRPHERNVAADHEIAHVARGVHCMTSRRYCTAILH